MTHQLRSWPIVTHHLCFLANSDSPFAFLASSDSPFGLFVRWRITWGDSCQTPCGRSLRREINHLIQNASGCNPRRQAPPQRFYGRLRCLCMGFLGWRPAVKNKRRARATKNIAKAEPPLGCALGLPQYLRQAHHPFFRFPNSLRTSMISKGPRLHNTCQQKVKDVQDTQE